METDKKGGNNKQCCRKVDEEVSFSGFSFCFDRFICTSAPPNYASAFEPSSLSLSLVRSSGWVGDWCVQSQRRFGSVSHGARGGTAAQRFQCVSMFLLQQLIGSESALGRAPRSRWHQIYILFLLSPRPHLKRQFAVMSLVLSGRNHVDESVKGWPPALQVFNLSNFQGQGDGFWLASSNNLKLFPSIPVMNLMC